jgi:hypothetical protein
MIDIFEISVAFSAHCLQGGIVRGSEELLEPLIDRLSSLFVF